MEIVLRNVLDVPEAAAQLGFDTGDHAEIVVSMFDEVAMSNDEEGMGYEELIPKLIAKMHRTLAYLGLCGEMVFDNCLGHGEEREEIRRVLDRLSERDRTITPEDVVRVRKEETEASEQTASLVKRLATFAKEDGLKRGLNREERRTATIGDLFPNE